MKVCLATAITNYSLFLPKGRNRSLEEWELKDVFLMKVFLAGNNNEKAIKGNLREFWQRVMKIWQTLATR